MALARSAEKIPKTAGKPGAWAYELKFDGWRLVLLRPAAGGVELWSRRGTNLTDRFPEIAAAALNQVPAGAVVDGEVCVFQDGRLDWGQLQVRMGSAARIARQVKAAPASYIAFDVLATGGADIRDRPWTERHAVLEQLAHWQPPLQVCPHTLDYEEAVRWSSEYRDVGIEGVVAKATTAQYAPGQRASWVKVKSRETTEVVVGAVTGSLQRPESVIAGLVTQAGQLSIVGRTTALNAQQAADLATHLRPIDPQQHPWPAQIGSQFGGSPVHVVHVSPDLVAEVSADTALQAGRWRHPLRLLRLRPDMAVDDLPKLGEGGIEP